MKKLIVTLTFLAAIPAHAKKVILWRDHPVVGRPKIEVVTYSSTKQYTPFATDLVDYENHELAFRQLAMTKKTARIHHDQAIIRAKGKYSPVHETHEDFASEADY